MRSSLLVHSVVGSLVVIGSTLLVGCGEGYYVGQDDDLGDTSCDCDTSDSTTGANDGTVFQGKALGRRAPKGDTGANGTGGDTGSGGGDSGGGGAGSGGGESGGGGAGSGSGGSSSGGTSSGGNSSGGTSSGGTSSGGTSSGGTSSGGTSSGGTSSGGTSSGGTSSGGTSSGGTSSGGTSSGGTPVASCTDGIKNGQESDVDCGGDCGACKSGKACQHASDCLLGVCIGLGSLQIGLCL